LTSRGPGETIVDADILRTGGVVLVEMIRGKTSRFAILGGIVLAALAVHGTCLSAAEGGRQVEVKTCAELEKAVRRARPGDVIVLADGDYGDKDCNVSGKGTAKAPIVVRAKNTGKVVMNRKLWLKGEHVSLIGVRFGKGRVTISGRGLRMSRCIMSDVRHGTWVRVDARSRAVEIDHCLFERKNNNKKAKRSCQLMQIRVLNKKEGHHVHHNHFRDIPKGGGGNGFETIQLITEGNPFDPPGGHCETVIENNLFERCNGEPEIISVKANGNVIRGNTFRACRGAVVLRHGDDNTVTGNFFLGAGEAGSGGVRLQGTGQVVTKNYFHGLGRFGVAMMDGTDDKMYVRVERASVTFNTFVNCRYALLVGINHSKYPTGTVPRECLVSGNVFFLKPGGVAKVGAAADASFGYDLSAGQIVKLVKDDEPEAWKWADNIAQGKLGITARDGIRAGDAGLRFAKSGLALPTGKRAIGSEPLTEKLVGPQAPKQ
jgi:poly(beta-D-mannuronate) lyase